MAGLGGSDGRGATIRIGIDTGGTFTDIVAVRIAAGGRTTRRISTKTPSTPDDPSIAFLRGIGAALELLGAGPAEVESVRHGTTVATNHLLQGAVTPIGLITTEGYESILEIARQSVPDGYGNSYFWVKPPRIVPADLVRTVGGRLDAAGQEIRPFDEASAVAAVRLLRDRGVVAIGVCLLHSYRDDKHERALAEVIRREYPDAVVSLSSRVLPEYREYERAMTTLVDAAVKPTVANYVSTIQCRLDNLDPGRRIPFSIMRSNGGVLSAAEVVEQPISTVLSGPAAGVLGAAAVAARAGFESVVTCDGGGTSTDVAVVLAGRPSVTTDAAVGAFPVRVPMVDVVTVGAGGGSIAWVSPEGTLKVGPRSAGADPGPACYGHGGIEPTVTDAALLLGRIPPRLIGGGVQLDLAAAGAAIAKVAAKLNIGAQDCAAGMLEIFAWNQANALRRITTGRGLDVRDFPLVTFGGSGSLLACRLLDLLGAPTVLVPPDPGNVSAYGLLTVDVRCDDVRTRVSRDDELDVPALATAYRELTERTREALRREGFAGGVVQRVADLRYLGQAYEVNLDCPDGPIDREWADRVVDRFHDSHRFHYGYDFRGRPDQPVEWVNLRTIGTGPVERPAIPEIPAGTGTPVVIGTRRVRFDDWVDAALFDRATLRAGDVVDGPAIVQEFGSTVPVHPGCRVTVDRYGNLLLVRA
ncbi:hydantoinase/oxoprolinase family protein [Nakamurella sp.]|uniref:hydantoinase/oxoprolinase family protein n=1 Tax=Nakamurella sp. TaxID=1869182 RepID=UPI0037848166